MARKIKKLDWITYVPEAFENRAEEDPITCEVHYLSASEYRRYQNMLKMKQKRDGTVDVPNKDQVNRKILADNVRNITNYEHEEQGPLTTGAELFDHGEQELVDELLEVVDDQSRLREGAVGNYGSQSDS